MCVFVCVCVCVCVCGVCVSYECTKCVWIVFEFLLADCCLLYAVAVCYKTHVGEDVFTT